MSVWFMHLCCSFSFCSFRFMNVFFLNLCDQFYFLKFIDSLSFPKHIITSHHLFCSTFFQVDVVGVFYTSSRKLATLLWNLPCKHHTQTVLMWLLQNHLTSQHKRSMWEKRVQNRKQQQQWNNIVHVSNQIRWKTI